jgi:hypothetical protein
MNKLALPESLIGIFSYFKLAPDTPVVDCVGLTDRERDVLITQHCIPHDVSETSPRRIEQWWSVGGYVHSDVVVLVGEDYRIDPDSLNGEEYVECIVRVEAIHDEFGWRRGKTWCNATVVQVAAGVLIAKFDPFEEHAER